jgi:DNA-binding CsgD family transcriptional regulator
MDGTLDAVIGSLREVDGCRTVNGFADRAIDLLWDLIPCADLVFNELDEASQTCDVYRFRSASGFDPEDVEDDDFWAYADDLPICWGLAPGAAGVVRTQDVISIRQLQNSKIYSEVLQPYATEYEMKLAFASPPWVSRAFLFSRADRPFTQREADVARLLGSSLSKIYARVRAASRLTAREREVLEQVQQGLTNREIADALDIAPGTVRAHLEHSFTKLGVRTRTAAVAALN